MFHILFVEINYHRPRGLGDFIISDRFGDHSYSWLIKQIEYRKWSA